MNTQQVVQIKSSVNGFGCRQLQSPKSSSSRLATIGKGSAFERASRDRLFYTTACLIGLQVEVQVLDGSVFSGILHATNADKDFDIVLKMARLIKDCSRGQKDASEYLSKPTSKTFIIPAKELVQVTSKGVHLTPDDVKTEYQWEKQHELMTDSCISQSRPIEAERELERWVPDGDTPECPELENIFDGHWNRGWNQFEVNETLFGVKSTFNEELYTTKLERGPQMRDLEREASRIAREIQGEETHDVHLAEERGSQLHGNLDIDEETLYSSVFRGLDDSGFDDCEDILLDACNDETFQDISNAATRESFTNMISKKSNDGAQEPSATSSTDEAQLSTRGVVSSTNHNKQPKDSLDECVYDMDDSRVRDIQISEQTGASCSNKDTGKQKLGEERGEALKPLDSLLSKKAQSETSDNNDLSSDVASVTSLAEGRGKMRGIPQSANSKISSVTGLSRNSSSSSMASEKSNLNPNAKEFRLNPNAKIFVPSQAPSSPASPVSDGSFYYHPSNVTPIQQVHGMSVGIGMGPSYAGHQPVLLNPQVASTQQQYYHPNGHQYGQQMIIGHPRQVVYMPTYPHEMPCRRGDF
ncbi:unnamed protein product [Cuscuta epithymum]|uniref:LsmAD domain-containing protein n=1 Tax=Cuscuta epithymum TaxID=186058 RepID=A0AAV0F3X6_9ASTE|nr:unnamed protein product [Cuscuta epithymum]